MGIANLLFFNTVTVQLYHLDSTRFRGVGAGTLYFCDQTFSGLALLRATQWRTA